MPVLWTLVALWFVMSGATAARAGEELIGLQFGKHRIETLLALKRDGRFWIPLDSAGTLLSLELLKGAGKARQLATPLGTVDVPESAIVAQSGATYIDQKFLETRLNTHVRFDDSDAILVVDPPWRPGARVVRAEPGGAPLVAEAVPPETGLTTVHGDVSYRFDAEGEGRFEGYFRATGHAYGGVWQLNYEEDLLTRHRIRDAIWMKQLDDNRFVQIGHQSVGLHPLLESIEFTGVQYAWTNARVARSQGGLTAGALLDRRVEHDRTFDGRGPIGGRAELWLDGQQYAQMPIGLDGTFRFQNVHLPSRQSRVVIRIFDSRDSQTPVKTIERQLNLSDLLMEKGGHAVIAGGGYGGNAFDQWSTDRSGRSRGNLGLRPGIGVAAFAIGRHAVSDDLTVEAGATVTEESARAMAGAVGRLGADAVGAVSGSYDSEAGTAYLAEVNWRKTDWQVVARSYWRKRPYRSAFGTTGDHARTLYDPDWDHFLEIAYAANQTLRGGLIARHQPEASYVLPFARWQPNRKWTLEARPDQYGVYRFDARYQMSRRASLAASYSDGDGSVSYSRWLANDWTLTAEVQRNWLNVWRAGLRLNGSEAFGAPINWNVGGYVFDSGDYALSGGVRKEVRPGVQVYADGTYSSTSGGYFRRDRLDDWQLRIGLAFDLGFSEGRTVAAPTYGVNIAYGSLAGRIGPKGGTGGAEYSNIAIQVDGRVVGHTRADGSFYIANLETGTRVVEFDDENLPIEQNATKKRVVAKIVAGALTTVSFVTEARYGIAGEVANRAGQPIPGAMVVIADAAGKTVGETSTNSFGSYRVDELPPGRYTAVLRRDDGEGQRAARAFTIAGDYLFNVDLKAK